MRPAGASFADGVLAGMGWVPPAFPARCCANCACRRSDGVCNRALAGAIAEAESRLRPFRYCSDSDFAVHDFGLCRMWISDGARGAFEESGSIEEAKIRAAALGDGSFLDELGEWFPDQRRATDRMLSYAREIAAWGLGSPFPLAAMLPSNPLPRGERKPAIVFGRSYSFWRVRKWLADNEPAYLDAARRERSGLGEMMI